MKRLLILIVFVTFFAYTALATNESHETNSIKENECEFIDIADSFIIGSSRISFDDAKLMSQDTDIYETLHNGFRNFENEIDISSFGLKTSDQQELCDIFGDALRADPKLYYVSFTFRYRYNSKKIITKIIPQYTTTNVDEIEKIQAQIDARINEIAGLTNDSMSDIEKLLVIYNEIVLTSNYDTTLVRRTGMDILVYGESVCQGYASAMHAIADKVGIKGCFVRSEEMNHIWNAFLVNGEWYHLDATYGDPFEKYSTEILYTSFLKSNSWLRNELEYSGFTNINSVSKAYDEYFWNNTRAPVISLDGHMFFVEGIASCGNISMFNSHTNEITKIYEFTNYWPSTLDWKYHWEGTFSGLAYINGRFYFNTNCKILSCNPNGSAIKTIFEIPPNADYSIMGCCNSNNKIRYILATIERITFIEYNTIEIDNTFKPGDVNNDSDVDMNDAVLLLQHSMFPTLYPLYYVGSVDFTGDGEIDMNDAILLLQHSMFPELYPIE